MTAILRLLTEAPSIISIIGVKTLRAFSRAFTALISFTILLVMAFTRFPSFKQRSAFCALLIAPWITARSIHNIKSITATKILEPNFSTSPMAASCGFDPILATRESIAHKSNVAAFTVFLSLVMLSNTLLQTLAIVWPILPIKESMLSIAPFARSWASIVDANACGMRIKF